jgi:protein gp37
MARDTPCVPYDGLDLHEIDWLIVGGESGPGHR